MPEPEGGYTVYVRRPGCGDKLLFLVIDGTEEQPLDPKFAAGFWLLMTKWQQGSSCSGSSPKTTSLHGLNKVDLDSGLIFSVDWYVDSLGRREGSDSEMLRRRH